MKRMWAFGLMLAAAMILSGCEKGTEDAEEAISGIFDQVEAGFDGLEERLDDLDQTLNGSSDTAAEQTAEPEQTEEPAAQEAAEVSVSDDAIRPEVKNAIDDYEEFFAEYAEFMANYSASNDALGMMGDYLSMMQQYTEAIEGFDKMEDMEMTTAELKYYTDASLRISQSLLAAGS